MLLKDQAEFFAGTHDADIKQAAASRRAVALFLSRSLGRSLAFTPYITTASNSLPFALCSVLRLTRPVPSTRPARWTSGISRSAAGSVLAIISAQTCHSCSEFRAITRHGAISSTRCRSSMTWMRRARPCSMASRSIGSKIGTGTSSQTRTSGRSSRKSILVSVRCTSAPLTLCICRVSISRYRSPELTMKHAWLTSRSAVMIHIDLMKPTSKQSTPSSKRLNRPGCCFSPSVWRAISGKL
ncbi:hypothetical protein ABIB99_008905 [Bradyrhizobium sp. LA6.1]